MRMLKEIVRKIESAILDYWESTLPKTVFVPVRIYRKK
jgi:hypothetical protein